MTACNLSIDYPSLQELKFWKYQKLASFLEESNLEAVAEAVTREKVGGQALCLSPEDMMETFQLASVRVLLRKIKEHYETVCRLEF